MKSPEHDSHPRPAVGTRSRAGAAFAVLVLCATGLWGCGGGVRVIRESPESGVVLYVYKGVDGHRHSVHRSEASAKMRAFCRGPYRVIKEGDTKGRPRVIEGIGDMEDVVTERWWGIRFRCEADGGAASKTGRALRDQPDAISDYP